MALNLEDAVARTAPAKRERLAGQDAPTAAGAPHMAHALKYRPDIDGLRALAVLSVILYHVDASWLPGGFVGVDIFFVISGYLISKLILEEVEATGTLSFANFYKRRISRLFPALFAVVAGCLVAAAVLAPPDMLASFGASAVGTLLSASNFVFWSQSGYFDAQNLSKPLLHAWSLSVEEQFYLVWPLLLLLSARRSRRAPWIVLSLLAAASLAGSIFMQDDRASIYYLLPFRLFELAIGGLLLWAERAWPVRRFANAIAVLGFALMLYPVFAYSDATLFPSYNALMPCLGTALLIYAGAQSTLARATLANRVLVPIGLISYSLYLVHWPLLVFERLTPAAIETQPTVTIKLGLCVLMLVLATLLYRFVEQPMRRAGSRQRFPRVALVAALATVLLAIPAVHAWRSGGWPGRFPSDISRLVDPREINAGIPRFDPRCFLEGGKTSAGVPPSCYQAKANGLPNILLLGDSTALHYTHGLALLLKDQANILLWANAACPILPNHTNDRNPACLQNSRVFYREILPKNHYDIVIISAATAIKDFREALPAGVQVLERTGAQVVVLGQPPSFRRHVPDLIAKHGTTAGLGELLAANMYDGCIGESGFDHYVAPGRFFSVQQVFCTPVGIRYQDDEGNPIFADHLHYGMRGSVFMGRKLIAFMNTNLGTHFVAGQLPDYMAVPSGAAVKPTTPNLMIAPMSPLEGDTVFADMQAFKAALAAYRRDHGEYPRSVGFDGLITGWGKASADWIPGLVPRYLPRLPRDPRVSTDPRLQYLYRSDGKDYKLISHGSCWPLKKTHPEMIDPKRDCFAAGIWTAGARGW
jgi:peptidoglycan/LPS O-acetylase OafA/YrhL